MKNPAYLSTQYPPLSVLIQHKTWPLPVVTRVWSCQKIHLEATKSNKVKEHDFGRSGDKFSSDLFFLSIIPLPRKLTSFPLRCALFCYGA